jgi:predicted AAA+ superfamily ATPase
MEYFKINNSYLITKDREDIEKIDNKNIVIMPLYKWLLEFDKHT